MHIGLIGGIGPAATVFYYDRIVRAFAEHGQSPSLTIAHTSARALSQNVAQGRALEQADEFHRVACQLAAAGATSVVITSMGGHFCAKEFSAISPIPMIDGPGSVSASLKQSGIQRVGILGTRVVMESQLYGALEDLSPISPLGDDLAQVNDDYVAIAIAGAASSDQRERLLGAGKRLVEEQGAEVVLLGGTDLNLVFDNTELDFPVIDSALVHVDAIVKAAMSEIT